MYVKNDALDIKWYHYRIIEWCLLSEIHCTNFMIRWHLSQLTILPAIPISGYESLSSAIHKCRFCVATDITLSVSCKLILCIQSIIQHCTTVLCRLTHCAELCRPASSLRTCRHNLRGTKRFNTEHIPLHSYYRIARGYNALPTRSIAIWGQRTYKAPHIWASHPVARCYH